MGHLPSACRYRGQIYENALGEWHQLQQQEPGDGHGQHERSGVPVPRHSPENGCSRHHGLESKTRPGSSRTKRQRADHGSETEQAHRDSLCEQRRFSDWLGRRHAGQHIASAAATRMAAKGPGSADSDPRLAPLGSNDHMPALSQPNVKVFFRWPASTAH